MSDQVKNITERVGDKADQVKNLTDQVDNIDDQVEDRDDVVKEMTDQIENLDDSVVEMTDELAALAEEIKRITALVEVRLTYEEQEALPGFAIPTPRRVTRKTDIKTEMRGGVIAGLVVALGIGTLAFFAPALRMSIAIGGGVFVGLVSLCLLSALPRGLWEEFQQRRLVREGVAVVGKVVKREIKVDMGSQGPVGWTDYILTYEFQTQSGTTITATRTSSERPREGGPILVLYLPNSPARNAPFLNLIYEPIAP